MVFCIIPNLSVWKIQILQMYWHFHGEQVHELTSIIVQLHAHERSENSTTGIQRLYHWILLFFCFSKHPRTLLYLVWSWNANMLKFRKILNFQKNLEFWNKILGFSKNLKISKILFFRKNTRFFETLTCSHFTTRQDMEEFLGVLRSRKRVESSGTTFVFQMCYFRISHVHEVER